MNTTQAGVAGAVTAVAGGSSWVDRRSGLGVDDFIAEYRDPRRPVVLGDAARAWPLYGRADPDYFRRTYGEHVVRVRVTRVSLDERKIDLELQGGPKATSVHSSAVQHGRPKSASSTPRKSGKRKFK